MNKVLVGSDGELGSLRPAVTPLKWAKLQAARRPSKISLFMPSMQRLAASTSLKRTYPKL